MAKVYLICGKICSGKTTYSARLCKDHHAVMLSVDEITLALFGQDAGEMHDIYTERTKDYLFRKSLEIISAGTNVVLDWGFWTRNERIHAGNFYDSRNIDHEFHYIDISPEEWKKRIQKRNLSVLEHKTDAYYVDESLAQKFEKIFELPDRYEIDVWKEQ